MTIEAPMLYGQNLNDLITNIKDELATYGWKGQEGEAGMALVYLFGRLAELVATRLNQVPDKYFLAFLNEAGVNLLAPRSASVDLTFTPAKDILSSVNVPAGTQVATKQTETQAEVIFETGRSLVVVTNTLVKCVAFDPLNFSDCTAKATGQTSGSFAVFQGDQERERVLYLGDKDLLTFTDDASRQAAVITLSFEFDEPGGPIQDGWKLKWLYWDGAAWTSLPDNCVNDGAKGFSQNGDVTLTTLPTFVETEVNGVSTLWLACKLTGGSARDHLPVLRRIRGCRTITDLSGQGIADAAFSALQSGTAFVLLDTGGEFFPLGQIPGRLDTFYLQVDEAFSKQGATITIQMNLVGVKDPQNISELKKLRVQWQYHSSDGWISLGTSTYDSGVESPQLGFKDYTNAFTANGSTYVEFKCAKLEDKSLKPFEKTTVNDQEGYWVRARVVAGSYNEPGKLNDEWLPLKTHAPVISNLKVTYSSYTAPAIGPKPIILCRSRVDGIERDHSLTLPLVDAGQDQIITAADEEASVQLDASASLASVGQSITRYTWQLASSRLKHTFSPFRAADEGPAIYIGFQNAFPQGDWIEILLDVDEEQTGYETLPTVFWEYWNGDQWTILRVSDRSQGLTERGYLGFFGPDDYQSSIEFGQSAYWLRARPHRPPVANAGDSDISITTSNDETTITLDAIASQAFDRENISRYTWRLVSSIPPLADAGQDQKISTTGDEATVELDASGSTAGTGQKIDHYTWRIVGSEEEQSKTTFATSYVKVIRLNTVPVLNAVTISEEVLGSSDGIPNQVFTLLRPPVLPDVQISVREPDHPPAEELGQLEDELQEAEEGAQALPSGSTSDEGVWVRWHLVSDFHESGPQSRHCILDPIVGQIRFGDDERGKIPPVGSNNIKAMLYHTHNGASGNAQAGTITVLRNPSGDLANIKGVTNYEAAVGGSDKETTDEVKQRGPQSLKHRQRAVGIEDFIWLALEASGEVAQARCLPTCDQVGLSKVGWVTVVITPKGTDARPTPTPALLRHVQGYLEDHALANLKAVNHIHVKGAEYIEVTVTVQVKPTEPQESDKVKLAVLKQLENFLHPLAGGPERKGWKLGRDVYLSEVCAEIEAVSGVDHVASVRLLGSLQQYRLHIRKDSFTDPEDKVTDVTIQGGYRRVPFDIPSGSQVSTFDDQIKLLLAEPALKEEDGDYRGLRRLVAYGFKEGDKVKIVAADDTVLVRNLTIASIATAIPRDTMIKDVINFDQPFKPPAAWSQRDALMSDDGCVRLLLASDGDVTDSSDTVTGVTVCGFKAGDKVSLVVGGQHHPALEFLPIESIDLSEDHVFVPDDYLVCSGHHDVEMVLED